MNDVAELKQFTLVHAKTQRIAPGRFRRVLDRITNDEDSAPGSWAREWSAEAQELERRGKLLAACRHWALARFPFADGPARRAATQRCAETFDRWRHGTGIERLDVSLPGGTARCWATGLTGADRPVLVVMGGIVTVKEQWAPILAQARRLGMAGVVAEMPGVGENTLTYDRQSWRMLPAILDQVAGRADTARTYAVALSFSGHLALRTAAADRRIRGIITVGAPVGPFFTDEAWRRQLPRITTDTLAHLTGGSAGFADGWALTDAELAAVEIPVHYLASTRDEIIPGTDVRLLHERAPDIHVVTRDDVHAAPRHVLETRLWVASSLLRLQGRTGLRPGMLETLRRSVHAGQRLTGARG